MASFLNFPEAPAEGEASPEFQIDYRALADAIPQLVWVTGPSGDRQYFNASWYSHCGLAADESPSDDWSRVVHPLDLDGALKRWSRALRTQTPYEAEYRVRSADGTYRWFLARAEPIRDDAGSIAAWVGTCSDIDDRKVAEALAAESVSAFRALADAIPQIVWTAKPDGFLDWYNHAWYDFTGQTEEEAAGWGWQAVHHPEDFPEVMQRWPHSIASGEPFEMEFRLRRHDGVFRWFLTRVQPLRDEKGQIVRWYGTNTDIEVNKRTENALVFLSQASSALATSLDFKAAGRQVARIAVERFCDVCFFDVANETGQLVRVEFAATDGSDGDQRRASCIAAASTYGDDHPSLVALRRGESTLATHVDDSWIAATAGDAEEAACFRAFGLTSYIAVPIPVRGRPRGVVTFALAASSRRHFESTDLALAEDLGRRVGVTLDNAQAYERERRVAMTLQEAFLPKSLPKSPGLVFDATYVPAKAEAEVGGDWYDVFRLPDGRIAITIGDVCGNGLAAAATMGKLRQAMQSAAMIQPEPTAMLDAADLTLRLHESNGIATALGGILDPVALTFTYASAGHPSPLLLDDDGFTEFVGAEPPLSLRDTGESVTQTIQLSRGTLLVLYTDGLIESTRDLYEGERRLRLAVADPAIRYAEHPARAIFDSVLHDGSRDDVVILTVSVARIAQTPADGPGIAVAARSSLPHVK